MKKSIEQKAVDFAGDRSLGAGHGYPNYTVNLLEKGFLEGHKSAEKEYKTERQYWLDKESTDLKTNDEMLNAKDEIIREYRKALKYFTNRVEEGSIKSKTTYQMFKNLLEKYE